MSEPTSCWLRRRPVLPTQDRSRKLPASRTVRRPKRDRSPRDTFISPPTPDPATVEAWSDETEPISTRDPQTWSKTWVMAAILALAGIDVLGQRFGLDTWRGQGPDKARIRHRNPASSPTPIRNWPPPPAPAPAPTSAPTPAPTCDHCAGVAVNRASTATGIVGISPEMVAVV